MNSVFVGGKKVRIDPSKAIGKGGEADVFDVGSALKIFKPPTHIDYQGQPQEQRGAKERIATHQKKLPDFPRNLPKGVVVPDQLATDDQGRIVGYTMPLLRNAEVLMRYSDRGFRQAIDPNSVFTIFADLHRIVHDVHDARVVIGDFNDLNVLVTGGREAHVIDADSFQFGPYACKTFTAKFVDPMLCDPSATSVGLVKPHGPGSDWYAFTVMLMQSLLYVDPYGGIYRPSDPAARMPHQQRPLKRVTVFNPEVKYPKPAIPYDRLSDEVLELFHRVFEKDERGEFPLAVLQAQRWTKCTACGTEHSRAVCPSCQVTPASVVKATTVIRGTVTATRVFKTPGVIVCAAAFSGRMRWLAHHNGEYRDNKDELLMLGDLIPGARVRLTGTGAIMASGRSAAWLKPGTRPEPFPVDTFQGFPSIDANESAFYWIEQGSLMRSDPLMLAPLAIGRVLRDQTLFWVGGLFGFGLYRAGELCRPFTFDAFEGGISDITTGFPVIRGQLVDATCVFSDRRAWFFTATQERGKRIHRCVVMESSGLVIATAEAEQGDGTWLGTLRGKTASGRFLLAPTEDGMERVEAENGLVAVAARFPDTENFVDSASQLFAGNDGVYVVNEKEIYRLEMRQAQP